MLITGCELRRFIWETEILDDGYDLGPSVVSYDVMANFRISRVLYRATQFMLYTATGGMS